LYLYKLEQNYVRNEWAWKRGSSPLPSDATDEEADADVESHAVHPDGRTIFASSSFTFSLDTESGESAFRGSWLLPFHGRAYHDSDLDVGLKTERKRTETCFITFFSARLVGIGNETENLGNEN
jgi:hypothetical protein